jgi:hypothetical protein
MKMLVGSSDQLLHDLHYGSFCPARSNTAARCLRLGTTSALHRYGI